MGRSTLVSGATVLTMVPGEDTPLLADVRFEDGVITHIGGRPPGADRVVDASGGVLLPAFVQPHLHLCQSLFRNLADDLHLIDWLELRIWPMEAALDEAGMRAAADLGLAELIRGGTTTILDMGSVHHTDAIGEAVVAAGSRAFIGKAMMDHGAGVPSGLREDTHGSLAEAEALQRRWDGAADGRVRYAYAPRFGPSCTPELLRAASALAEDSGLLLHTHCAESEGEIALVHRDFGMGNLEFLAANGMTGPRSVFAHMVHLDPLDLAIVQRTDTGIAHCPSSNCKLASGVAPIPDYLARGLRVGLGADGAPCNNNLDAFVEMRLAALIHKPRFGPRAMDARTVLGLATREGARLLGLGDQLGTIEVGKRADLVHLRLDRPFNGVAGDVYGQIVYTGSRENVHDVWCEGRRLVDGGALTTLDEAAVMAHGREAAARVLGRL
jgi:5-methylthioadenosine/S-adenosylhomocysteine deaminase